MIILQSGVTTGIGASLASIALVLLLGILLYIALIKLTMDKQFVSHWHHYVEDFDQSPLDFYNRITEKIRENEVPNVRTQTHNYKKNTGPFSGSRTYLQVISKGYFFIIGAAPYAKGFFVSYWQLENRSEKANKIGEIPFIGPLIVKLFYTETFYTVDTRMMFQKMIHSCVIGALEKEMKNKGLRALTESERKVEQRPFYEL